MPRVDLNPVSHQWEALAMYRDRYDIDHLLSQVDSLERSINRRQARRATAQRRLDVLEQELVRALAEVKAAEAEIEGSRAAGALLIEEILDGVRREKGEVWSPTPVRGFRVWSIRAKAIFGNQTQWHSPTLTARCLRGNRGEDLPHSMQRCGPPACGIYAVKSLELFPPEVASCQINHTVVGVVEMGGKVVEHELGFRAKRATAVGVVTKDGGRSVAIAEPSDLDAFFADPEGTATRLSTTTDPSPGQARAFLESVLQKAGQWT